MTKSFRRALNALVDLHFTELEDILTSAEDALFSDDLLQPDEPLLLAHYEGRPPPKKILNGAPSGPTQFQQALDHVEPRWKLDVVLALQDYVDE